MLERTTKFATIIEAQSHTKNLAGKRDPETRQIRIWKEWHFRMNLHVGAYPEPGLAHRMRATEANAPEITESNNLLHGKEKEIRGDAGDQGIYTRQKNR